jgi:hypothetical protein
MTALMLEPKIEKVLEFPIDSAHMLVDATIILCIDPRWWNRIGKNPISAVQAFADAKGWAFVPLNKAGGIKVLASRNPADDARKRVFLSEIEEELGLHHPKILAITVHRDCGGYGYAKAFGNDADRENERLYGDLLEAKSVLEEKFGSRVRIELYVFDAKGAEQVSF